MSIHMAKLWIIRFLLLNSLDEQEADEVEQRQGELANVLQDRLPSVDRPVLDASDKGVDRRDDHDDRDDGEPKGLLA